jgi:hypothetical protein
MSSTASSHLIQADGIFLNSPSIGIDFADASSLWEFKHFLECEDSIKYVSQFLDLEEKLPEIT